MGKRALELEEREERLIASARKKLSLEEQLR